MNYEIRIFLADHFGQVYLGTLLSDDSTQGKPVAIKMIESSKNKINQIS